ncbi:hypothetical protein [Streptomyces paradoxus]
MRELHQLQEEDPHLLADERHPRNYLAFLGLAAALCCYKRLLRLTM